MRTDFSTRGAPLIVGVVHSPGSKVRPYLANRIFAFSSCIALVSLAVIPIRDLLVAGTGLFSLMAWVICAGTDIVGVVFCFGVTGTALVGLLSLPLACNKMWCTGTFFTQRAHQLEYFRIL